MKLIFVLLLIGLSANAQEHEWFPKHSRPGADPVYTDVSNITGLEIEARLQMMGGHYRTGRVKSKTWQNSDGRDRASQLIEVIYWDESEKVFVHGWQGAPDRKTAVIYNYVETITGPSPKIKGVFYEAG
jgi:hypothetical protein